MPATQHDNLHTHSDSGQGTKLSSGFKVRAEVDVQCDATMLLEDMHLSCFPAAIRREGGAAGIMQQGQTETNEALATI